MTFREWLKVNPGLWWWETGGLKNLAKALEVNIHRVNTKCDITVIPQGAPLVARLTATQVCRAYAQIHGRHRSPAEIVTCLRTLEIPDQFADRRADGLSELERTLIWLAMARVAATSGILLVEPLEGASQKHRSQLKRVLNEATRVHAYIVVVANHHESAHSLGATAVPSSVLQQ